jgi:Glycosyl Hydrolase Family 88
LVGERRYRGYAERWAAAHRWGLGGDASTRHADNQCAGQPYLDLYELRREPRRIAAIERSVRNMVYGPDKNDDWFWVDALHMAMPCFVRLGALRREPRERWTYWRKLYRLYDHTKRREGGGLSELLCVLRECDSGVSDGAPDPGSARSTRSSSAAPMRMLGLAWWSRSSRARRGTRTRSRSRRS